MWLIVFDDDMMEVEIIDIFQTWIYRDTWKRARFASHLLFHLLDVSLVDMHITECMDESSWLHSE